MTGVEVFQKTLDQAIRGDNVGLLLRGVEKDAAPAAATVIREAGVDHPAHRSSKPKSTCSREEEGGRQTAFFTDYRPQFYFRTTDVTGSIALAAGTEMVMPGDNVKITVDLGETPIAMEQGVRFAIREGGRTVGAGVVTKIIA